MRRRRSYIAEKIDRTYRKEESMRRKYEAERRRRAKEEKRVRGENENR